MANEVEIRVTADTKKAERGLQGLRGSLNRFSRQARVAGTALTAFGVVGAVGLKKLVDSAKEQEIGIDKLNQALRNVGQTYASNQTAIEGVIDSIQRKTNFGDEEQRESLRTLITIGGKYEGSLVALRVATDMAAGANMSLEGASLLLGKAIAGETSALSRYGIKLAEGATQTEIMTALTKQFGGMAEAAADPLTQLGNRMGDVGQKVGEFFIPLVDKAAIKMEKLATKLTEADPAMVRMVALFTGLSVGLALTVGPLLLMVGFIPFIAKGFRFLGLALIPVSKGLLLVAGLVAAGIILWRNWDHVTSFLSKVFESNFLWLLPYGRLIKALMFLQQNWDEVWEHIKNMFVDVVKRLLYEFDQLANAFISVWNFIVRQGQKLELFQEFEAIPHIKTDFKEFSATVRNSFESMGKSGEEHGGKLWESFKGGMESTFQELRTLLGGWLDDMGLGVEDFEKKMAEVNEAIDTMFGEDTPEAIDKTTDAMNKATNAVRSFNDLVLAGQFKSRVRGGTPEVVAYSSTGATSSQIPTPPLPQVEQLLLAIAATSDPDERKRRLAAMAAWISPHMEMLGQSGILDRIKSDKTFSIEGMIAYEKNYKSFMRNREAGMMANQGTGTLTEEERAAVTPFAHGGIVTRPTMALLGEAGPEAIVPLSGGRGLAPVYNITISGNTVFGEMDFKRLVVKAVTDSHRRGGLPFLGRA